MRRFKVSSDLLAPIYELTVQEQGEIMRALLQMRPTRFSTEAARIAWIFISRGLEWEEDDG